ncbi:MAG: hypothetical protein R2873_17285 [Caldilineaceae bacterium]
MNQSNNVHTVRNIVIFAVLVNVLAWLGPVLGGSPLEPGLGFLLWGVAPILTALIMRYALRDRCPWAGGSTCAAMDAATCSARWRCR